MCSEHMLVTFVHICASLIFSFVFICCVLGSHLHLFVSFATLLWVYCTYNKHASALLLCAKDLMHSVLHWIECTMYCIALNAGRGHITVGVHWFHGLLLPGQAPIIYTLGHNV